MILGLSKTISSKLYHKIPMKVVPIAYWEKLIKTSKCTDEIHLLNLSVSCIYPKKLTKEERYNKRNPKT